MADLVTAQAMWWLLELYNPLTGVGDDRPRLLWLLRRTAAILRADAWDHDARHAWPPVYRGGTTTAAGTSVGPGPP